MSHKRKKIMAAIAAFKDQELDPHYLGYFDCFNRQLFFEAHEVLETIWLKERGHAEDRFYKGLIQLAGAFVHLQKQRTDPATALFRLASANFSHYPPIHQRLNLRVVLELIDNWLIKIASARTAAGSVPELACPTPRLRLEQQGLRKKS